ncbi:MAG: hypothetical protein ACXACD_19955 [Candidatus Thorarchaeota archaeon]
MTENKDWWNCKPSKTAVLIAAETAVASFAEEMGLEYSILRKESDIVLKPGGDELGREIVWKSYGNHIVLTQNPYRTNSLIVINSEGFGNLYFMFEGNASAAFEGDLLNPMKTQKSAVGVMRATRGVSFAKQFAGKIVSVMNFETIEVGLIHDHSIPRGVGYSISKLGDTQWRIFGNQDDSETATFENPLLSLLNREFEMKDKSKMVSKFNKIEQPKYVQVNPRGSKTIVSVGSGQPLQGGSPVVVSTELKEFDNKWYIAVIPQPSLIRQSFEIMRDLSELARCASTDYDVYSGVLDTKDALPRYLAIELERQHALPGDEPISVSELLDESEDSRKGQIVGYLSEREPHLLWPKRLACTNCKAVYSYQASDSKSGYLECRNCLKQFPANQKKVKG